MFNSIRLRARSAATIGIAAALVVGGLAAAQGNGSNGNSEAGGHRAGKRPPPPMMGPRLRGLTYGQLHVRTKGGDSQVIRLDQGKILSLDESSITLEENDGNQVTVAIDENTEVHAGPGRSSVEDLSAGQRVLVCGPEGEAAKAVIVPPKRGAHTGGHRGGPQGAPQGGQLPPPPPGAQMGS